MTLGATPGTGPERAPNHQRRATEGEWDLASASDPELVAILRCPVSGRPLKRVTDKRLEEVNQALASGAATPLDGRPFTKPLTAGLGSDDDRYVYPVEDGVMFLMTDCAISSEDPRSDRVELDEASRKVRSFYDNVGWTRAGQGVFTDAVRFEDLRPVAARYIHECHLRLCRYIDRQGRYMLDAGSGPIQYPEYLSYSEGYLKRICVDISLAALRAAQSTLRGRGEYVLADVTNLPFADSSMDGAVSLHMIYHLPREKQEKAFQELYRVLAPARRAAIVYQWKKPILIQLLEAPLALRRFAGRILRKLGLRGNRPSPAPAGAPPEGMLFYDSQSYRWFVSRPWGFSYEIGVWRTVSVDVLRLYIHRRLMGGTLLRGLFALEERLPRLCAAAGQYGVISIRK